MAASLPDCQTLVTAIQALAAQAVLNNLTVGGVCYREYQQQVVAPASVTTINLTTQAGASKDSSATVADAADHSATLPVVRMLNDARFLANTVNTMAKLVAADLDAALCALYAQFVTFSPIGTGGSLLADADYLSILGAMSGAGIPAGELLFLALNPVDYTNIPAFTPLSTAANASDGLFRAAAAGGALSQWRGLRLIPTPSIVKTGSGPTTTNNFAFASSAIGLITLQRPLTNDATHVQVMSELLASNIGVHVALDYNSSNDSQVIHFRARYAAVAARTTQGVQVRS